MIKKMEHRYIKVGSVTLPNEPLSNFQLINAAKRLKIPHFRGVFLRNELPNNPKENECGVLNLDTDTGTHWVAWYKSSHQALYFDSYGIQPPTEIINYLNQDIYYPTEQVQRGNQVVCGHLCLYVLLELGKQTRSLQEIINGLF